MIDLVSVGAKISHFREENGYSQEALASKLFVSRQAISAWEVGKSAPSIDNIIELSKLFNVPFEDILCLNEKPQINDDDIFAGHERNYVIRSIISGKIKVDLKKSLYQCTGEERLILLKAISDKKIKANPSDLLPLLNNEERKILLSGGSKR
jgi:DNA-binding XRE family transcriptional regulator